MPSRRSTNGFRLTETILAMKRSLQDEELQASIARETTEGELNDLRHNGTSPKVVKGSFLMGLGTCKHFLVV